MKWDVYTGKQWWKAALILFGVIIGIVSLLYTETFLKELRAEEERKIVLWAKAIEAVFLSEDDTDLAFYSQIIQDNKNHSCFTCKRRRGNNCTSQLGCSRIQSG